MKKIIILSVLFGILPISVWSQDDLYFNPSKDLKTADKKADTPPTYYAGTSRDVDDYNRHGAYSSYYQKIGIDSLGNDIIEFHTGANDEVDTLSVYPGDDILFDTDDDYTFSRRISRFDDYYWDPWYYGHPYSYGYHPYWHYGAYGWYDPWYYGWYDPWYYGWYSPWHYGYNPWHYGLGWGGGYIHTNHGGHYTGTNNHGRIGRRSNVTAGRAGNFGGYRGNGQSTKVYSRNTNVGNQGNFGGYRGNSRGNVSTPTRSSSHSSGNFGGSRSSGYSGSTSGGSRGGSFSGGSGGGSRSGGGGGGSRGGSFGGRR